MSSGGSSSFYGLVQSFIIFSYIIGIGRMTTAKTRRQRFVGVILAVIPLLYLAYFVLSPDEYNSNYSGPFFIWFLVISSVLGILRIITAKFLKQWILGATLVTIPILLLVAKFLSTIYFGFLFEARPQVFNFIIAVQLVSWFIVAPLYANAVVATSNRRLSRPFFMSLFIIGFDYFILRILSHKLPGTIVSPLFYTPPLLFFLGVDLYRLLRGKELLVKKNRTFVAAHVITVILIVFIPSLNLAGNRFDKLFASLGQSCSYYDFWECPKILCSVVNDKSRKPVLCNSKSFALQSAKIESERHRQIPQWIIDEANSSAIDNVGKDFFDRYVTFNIFYSTYHDPEPEIAELRKIDPDAEYDFGPTVYNLSYVYYFPEIMEGSGFVVNLNPDGTLHDEGAPRFARHLEKYPPVITREKALGIAVQKGFNPSAMRLYFDWNAQTNSFLWDADEYKYLENGHRGSWSMTIDASTGAASDVGVEDYGDFNYVY